MRGLRQLIYSQSFMENFRTHPKHFTRKSILSFPFLIVFLLNFLSKSLQTELNTVFAAIFRFDVARRMVTASAFCQARRKIRPEAFVALNTYLLQWVQAHSALKTWQSHRVFAIDGTTFRLEGHSRETKDYFGMVQAPRGNPRCLARGSQIYDVLNKVTLDATIAPYSWPERRLALDHLSALETQLPQGSLFLLDRGYVDFEILERIRSLGGFFCLRAKKNLKIVKALIRSGQTHGVFEFDVDNNKRKSFRERGISLDPIHVRLLAVKFGYGATEYLMTSLLDTQAYPNQELSWLYHQRWSIEENYKTKKCRIEIENFTAKSLQSVFQDFHAKVFAENLTAVLTSSLDEEIEIHNLEKHNDYQLNFTAALAKMKHVIVLLFVRKQPHKLVNELLEVWGTDLSCLRPGRTYPRKGRGKNKSGKNKNPPKLQHYNLSYKRVF